MCLYYGNNKTDALIRRFKKGGGRIQAWKTLCPKPTGLNARHHCRYHYRPGWNRSNRKEWEKSPTWDGQPVNRGIHVWLSRRASELSRGKTVAVWCYGRDLVGAGKFAGEWSAVFQKVFLKRADYDKALAK